MSKEHVGLNTTTPLGLDMAKAQTQTSVAQDVESFNSNLSAVPIPTVGINHSIYEPYPYGIEYKEVNGEARLVESLIKEGTHLILEGEKGIGKTLLVHDICYSIGIPIVPLNCSSATSKEDLLGHVVIQKDGSFAFKLGVFPTAIEVANKHKSKTCLIYADEPNTLPADVQKIFNSLCDDRKSVVANDHIYRLNQGCKVVVVGAMNPLTYTGVNPLNEDFTSRFLFKTINMPNQDHLESVVDWKKGKEYMKQILIMDDKLRQARVKGLVDYTISTRDMQQFANVYTALLPNYDNPHEVLTHCINLTIVDKMPTVEQRSIAITLAKDIFGTAYESQVVDLVEEVEEVEQ